MSTESKKHHFVPRSILRKFQNENGRLFVFDKLTGKSFSSTAEDAGHENDFNSFKHEEGKLNFEDFFLDIDSEQAKLIRKIESFDDHWEASGDELYNLAFFTLVQMQRTKLPRTTLVETSKGIRKWAEEIVPAHMSRPIVPIVEDETSKLVMLNSIINETPTLVPYLLERGIIILKAPNLGPLLWISDNPVVMDNIYPYGRCGLNSPGTDVYFPISKNLIVGFIARSTCEKTLLVYNELQKRGQSIPPEIDKSIQAIYENKISDIEPRFIDYFNHLQVRSASRFLYSPTNDFELANEMVKNNPSLREKRSSVAFNEFSFPKMPEGEYIVLYLKNGNHLMIGIELQSSDYDLVFVVKDNDLLKMDNLFNVNSPIENIEVFKDKSIIRGMRDVIIKSFNKHSRHCVISHTDEGFNAILKHIRETKQKKE